MNPGLGKIPWRRERLATSVFWPGEFHGLYSPWGHKESDTTEQLSLSLSGGFKYNRATSDVVSWCFERKDMSLLWNCCICKILDAYFLCFSKQAAQMYLAIRNIRDDSDPCILDIFVESLLCARSCSRHPGHNSEQQSLKSLPS